jgi:TetR/AcrR family transcriptional repressor of mexJK operon
MTSLHPDKHTAILDAAHKRFARYGLTKVTMDEIAEDLGMSKAALYYYFPTKEDLYRNVVTSEQQDFADRMKAIVRGNAPAAVKLSGYFAEHLRLLGSLLDLRIIEAPAAYPVKPIMRDLFREFSSTETRFLEAIMREGKKRREFAVDFPEKTARLVQHVLQGLRMRFITTMRDREPREADIRAYRDEVLNFLKIFLKGISRQRNGVKNA